MIANQQLPQIQEAQSAGLRVPVLTSSSLLRRQSPKPFDPA